MGVWGRTMKSSPPHSGGYSRAPPVLPGLQRDRDAPIPPWPRQDRRDSGVTAAVWGRDLSTCPQTFTGRPYPSAAQAGPEGLGCNCRCVGGGTSSCAPQTPTGRLYPSTAQKDRRDSGVTAAVVGGGPLRVSSNPHGTSLSLHGPEGPEKLGCNHRPAGEERVVCPH